MYENKLLKVKKGILSIIDFDTLINTVKNNINPKH